MSSIEIKAFKVLTRQILKNQMYLSYLMESHNLLSEYKIFTFFGSVSVTQSLLKIFKLHTLVETSIFKIPQLCEMTLCTALQTFMSHKKTTYLIYAYIYVSENLHSILQIQITNLNAAILDLFQNPYMICFCNLQLVHVYSLQFKMVKIDQSCHLAALGSNCVL